MPPVYSTSDNPTGDKIAGATSAHMWGRLFNLRRIVNPPAAAGPAGHAWIHPALFTPVKMGIGAGCADLWQTNSGGGR